MTKAAVVTAIAALLLATAPIASARQLDYRHAHKLAVRLAIKQTKDTKHPVNRWRLFGAERVNKRSIVWVYNVDYADGTLCDAEMVVRVESVGGHKFAHAFFRDLVCPH
jgi:hypothetical protein